MELYCFILGLLLHISYAPVYAKEKDGKVIVELQEFRPCDNNTDYKIIFGKTELWRVDEYLLEISCVIEVLTEFSAGISSIMKFQRCPIGDRDNCEKVPESGMDSVCKYLFREDAVWKLLLENAKGLDKQECPISPGTYTTEKALLYLAKDDDQKKKIRDAEGEYMGKIEFLEFGKVIGCQHMEFTVKIEKEE